MSIHRSLRLAMLAVLLCSAGCGGGGGGSEPAWPRAWSHQDVGAGMPAGAATFAGGTFTVAGAGEWVWPFEADQMHYVYTQATGDFRLTVRVVTMEGVDTSSMAGLMARSSLEAGSPTFHYSLMPPQTSTMTGTGCVRQTADTAAQCGAEVCSVGLPVYLRIARDGDTFTAAYSSDGATWTPSTYTQTLSLPESVHVGFFVQSYLADVLETVTFDHVELTTE